MPFSRILPAVVVELVGLDQDVGRAVTWMPHRNFETLQRFTVMVSHPCSSPPECRRSLSVAGPRDAVALASRVTPTGFSPTGPPRKGADTGRGRPSSDSSSPPCLRRIDRNRAATCRGAGSRRRSSDQRRQEARTRRRGHASADALGCAGDSSAAAHHHAVPLPPLDPGLRLEPAPSSPLAETARRRGRSSASFGEAGALDEDRASPVKMAGRYPQARRATGRRSPCSQRPWPS